jgi:hypothetical protein
MPKRKVKKPKTIQLKQKQVVNIYTNVRKTRSPLSKGSKPMPQMNNMPTFNPIYRVQPIGTQTVELERRMNDEITNLKKELSTLREISAEVKNPLKDKVIPEHSNQIKDTMAIPETPKKKTLAKMNLLDLRAELTQRGVNTDGMKKKQMQDLLKRD